MHFHPEHHKLNYKMTLLSFSMNNFYNPTDPLFKYDTNYSSISPKL